MPIVTLTTDMGTRDFYVAAIKARLLSQIEQVDIVDISHHVEKFNINQAAYLLRNVYPEFPEGTVHIIGVRSEFETHIPHIVVRSAGQYFISADNGLFSFLLDDSDAEVFELVISQDTDDLTFPTKNIFSKAAVHLCKGGTPEVIGRKTEFRNRYTPLQPLTDQKSIKGHVTHVDSYENVMTNISQQMFETVGRGREFAIMVRRMQIKSIAKTYNSVPAGEAVALFGEGRFLELAINQGTEHSGGGASSLLGLRKDDMIRIEFYDT